MRYRRGNSSTQLRREATLVGFLGWTLVAVVAVAMLTTVVLFGLVVTPQDAGTTPSHAWQYPAVPAVIAVGAAWGAWRCWVRARGLRQAAVEQTVAEYSTEDRWASTRA